jgi:diguanylate cyclase (GGDEF)-like protein
MRTHFNLLLVEDSPTDADLVLDVLREAGFDPVWRRVETQTDYLKELNVPPDLILSDFSLPQFDGKTALQLMKMRGLEIPFIIVSGCIGEDMAVECMKAGASDYLLKDRLGRLAHSVSQALDRKRLVDEKRQVEQQLFLETFHDSLTGLPNRALFLDRVNRVILRNRRDHTHVFAVLYLSLEGVQVVQDSLGPPATDRLLIDVSQRLLRRVRSADTLARLGGEEFAILLDNLKSPDNATRVVERIRQEFTLPFMVSGQERVLTAYLGITSSTSTYEDSELMLRDAMTAMRRARTIGRSGFALFDHAMHEQAMTRLKLETDLRQALEQKQFRLHYQPIVALDTGRVAGFEALIRWQHPDEGLLMPHAFLTVATELGMLTALTEWSCEQACQQLQVWQATFPKVRPLTVSVNLSVEQFSHPDMVMRLRDLVRSTGIEAGSLKIEITESEMMQNPKAVSDILHQLNAHHIETCLDDFGTGYSSLSHLQRLPITFLKIDQSFVRRLGGEDDALAIVKTIIMLAHQLGRQVIAEGVETREHLVLLRSLGCEYAQGYFFAKPMPDSDIYDLLKAGRRW